MQNPSKYNKKWKFKIKINLFELKRKLSRTQNKVDLQKCK